MSSGKGYTGLKVHAISLLLFLVFQAEGNCQKTILDSLFTFHAGTVKTVNALGIVTRKTGYSFTYDSRLINPEGKCSLNFTYKSLGTILDSIFSYDKFQFTVIEKYIIISVPENNSTANIDTAHRLVSGNISGIIIDDESSEPLPYATIGLKDKGRGTVTNNNGEFGLNITPDLYSDTLVISYLGYIVRELPVRQTLGSTLTITMKREFISIPEIIIRNQIPEDIINKARKAIPANFGDTPASMIGFYREGVSRKAELQTYSEAILQIYKSSYSSSLQGDQIKVLKSRKIDNAERSDTLALRLKAGLSTCLELDGARNLYDFLSPMSMKDYTYRLSDIVTFDDEAAYAIDFEQRAGIDISLFKGTVYINTEDYGIVNVEFEINPAYIHQMKDTYLSSASHGFTTWPVSVEYSVSYRKVNDRYFLSHVRGDLIFTSKQNKRLFNTQFKVFFELAITETNLVNVTRFAKDEIAPMHSIFSRTITNYDSEFWGNQDFLKPEENLLQALKNIKVKLQEFSK